MARTKQTAVKRESSSEFFNKKSATWEDSNGKEVKATNGHAAAAKVAAQESAKGEAGLVQLVIAVSGIYASLYVFFFFTHDLSLQISYTTSSLAPVRLD